MKYLSIIYCLLFILSSPAEAFVVISNGGKPAKWEGNKVHYQLYGIPASFRDAVRESFRVWTEVDGVDLEFLEEQTSGGPGSRDGKNSVAWVKDGWTDLSFNPPSNALAVTLSSFDSTTGEIIDADIFFNAEDFSWAVIEDDEQDWSKVDVQNIATHEVGHMIGLDHSSVSLFETDPELYEATMFYASGAGEISRRVPQTDDQKGVRSLYPVTETSAPRITRVTEVLREGSYRIYHIQGSNFNELTSFVLTAGRSSIYDSVSRYRTIISSTEAEVEFDLRGFYVDEADLVAFNHPSSLASYTSLSVDGGDIRTNSSSGGGGGGGCNISANPSSIDIVWIVLAVFLLGFLQARRIRPAQNIKRYHQ